MFGKFSIHHGMRVFVRKGIITRTCDGYEEDGIIDIHKLFRSMMVPTGILAAGLLPHYRLARIAAEYHYVRQETPPRAANPAAKGQVEPEGQSQEGTNPKSRDDPYGVRKHSKTSVSPTKRRKKAR
jgi:hypothetical protein